MNTKERITKGIVFFRRFADKNYDAVIVEKYLPRFLDLVEEYVNQNGKKGDDYTFEEAKKIFGVK